MAEDMYDYSSSQHNLITEEYPFSRETTIDFRYESFADDIMSAQACLEVFTSDGQTGSINHLFQNNDPEKFATDLKQRLGKNASHSKVCIAGGWNKYGRSTGLGPRLIKALEKEGFEIGDCDINGNFSRMGRIFPEKVEIMRKSLETGKEDTKTLYFNKREA